MRATPDLFGCPSTSVNSITDSFCFRARRSTVALLIFERGVVISLKFGKEKAYRGEKECRKVKTGKVLTGTVVNLIVRNKERR